MRRLDHPRGGQEEEEEDGESELDVIKEEADTEDDNISDVAHAADRRRGATALSVTSLRQGTPSTEGEADELDNDDEYIPISTKRGIGRVQTGATRKTAKAPAKVPSHRAAPKPTKASKAPKPIAASTAKKIKTGRGGVGERRMSQNRL